MCRLQSVYGNKWSVIGRALGVSGRAAQDKYRNLVHKENTGTCRFCNALQIRIIYVIMHRQVE